MEQEFFHVLNIFKNQLTLNFIKLKSRRYKLKVELTKKVFREKLGFIKRLAINQDENNFRRGVTARK